MTSTTNFLTPFVRRWWLVGLLTVLGGLAGLAYARLTDPTYTATAYVAVVARTPADSSAVSYAQAYARIVHQGEVMSAAVDRSGGQASAGELRRWVRTSSSPDAPIIEITGSARTAAHAADLANLVAGALVSTAQRQSEQTRMGVTVLSDASPPDEPTSPRPALDVVVGAAVGLLAGGLALLTRSATADIARDSSPPPIPNANDDRSSPVRPGHLDGSAAYRPSTGVVRSPARPGTRPSDWTGAVGPDDHTWADPAKPRSS